MKPAKKHVSKDGKEIFGCRLEAGDTIKDGDCYEAFESWHYQKHVTGMELNSFEAENVLWVRPCEELPFQIIRYSSNIDDVDIVYSARSPYELLGWALCELEVSWLDRRIYCIRDARTGVHFYDCHQLDDIVEAAKDADKEEAYSPNRVVWG